MQENVVNKPQASRVTTTTAQVQANYDRLSRFYDLLAASELPYIELGLQLLDLGAGETVLEIGSGTGRALLPMAQAVGGTGRVCGLDISPGMLLAAQEKIDPAGLGPRLQLVCGGASALPYPTHTFDALFMSFTLELFDNPHIPLVLAGCRRVLKENGRICVVSLSRAAPPTSPSVSTNGRTAASRSSWTAAPSTSTKRSSRPVSSPSRPSTAPCGPSPSKSSSPPPHPAPRTPHVARRT